MPDHYTTLGVSPTATEHEVKAAYRKLAKKWHPDSLPEHQKAAGEKKFKEICEAYQHLKDTESRREYDGMPNYQHRPYRPYHASGAGPWTRATSRNSETYKRQHWGKEYDYTAYTKTRHAGFDSEFKGYAASEAAKAAPKLPRWLLKLGEGKRPMFLGLAAVTAIAGMATSTINNRKKEAERGYVLAWYNGQMGRWEEPTAAMLNRSNFMHYALRKVDPKRVHMRNEDGETDNQPRAKMRPWYKR
mmetsp:Transcript_46553/g.74838  ORF Transcript_46553/g.74838 Transcript_46553/m.74838 type:complete len:245 (+) Transcript_46553:109-843(+)